jgi:pimeloyl-ACP methyl ester carboxylesterase
MANYERTLEANSQIMTTALGDIEYAVIGEGVPYLSLHGTPGGYDQALAGRKAYPKDNVKTITVSRPGYLRTPLSSGATFEQQADLFAALLDKLSIDRVVVVASSGGGYDGLQFALRHPERCIALVMLAPAMTYEPLPEGGAPKKNEFMLGLQDFGIWALGDFVLWTGWGMKDRDHDDPVQSAYLKELTHSNMPAAARFEGRWNDKVQRSDPKVDLWPIERIAVPTLFIHGDADENSDYQTSVKAAARIPGAKLVTIKGADHFMIITHEREIGEHIRQFVGGVMAQGAKVQAAARSHF